MSVKPQVGEIWLVNGTYHKNSLFLILGVKSNGFYRVLELKEGIKTSLGFDNPDYKYEKFA